MSDAETPPVNSGLTPRLYAALSTYWHNHGWPATVVLIICLAISVGCIFSVRHAADAGRGGAVAVALSLLILFFFDNPGSKTFATLSTAVPKLKAIASKHPDPDAVPFNKLSDSKKITALQAQLTSLATRLTGVCNSFVGCQEINASAQFWINLQMALASGIGTLAWGFGDMIHSCLYPAIK